MAKKVVASAQAPRPQYWFDVPLGRSYFVLSNIANTTQNRIGVRLYISNKVAAVALEQLEPHKAEIEKQIGETLEWDPNPDKRDKIIALDKQVDLNDRDQWPQYCDWLVERVAKFRKVFGPRIKKLNLTMTKDSAEDEQ